jgi:hypothetical protein
MHFPENFKLSLCQYSKCTQKYMRFKPLHSWSTDGELRASTALSLEGCL